MLTLVESCDMTELDVEELPDNSEVIGVPDVELVGVKATSK